MNNKDEIIERIDFLVKRFKSSKREEHLAFFSKIKGLLLTENYDEGFFKRVERSSALAQYAGFSYDEECCFFEMLEFVGEYIKEQDG